MFYIYLRQESVWTELARKLPTTDSEEDQKRRKEL